MPRVLPSFLLTTDAKRKPDPAADAGGLRPGDGVVFRHYDAPCRLDLARTLARLARIRRLTLLVAADWRMAATVRADGIHLPEGLMRSGRIAPALGWARRANRLVTAACHDRLAVGCAHRLGVTALLISPVFATASHPGGRSLGLIGFSRLCRAALLPVYGLGGVRRSIAKRTGAHGHAGTIPLNRTRRAGINPA